MLTCVFALHPLIKNSRFQLLSNTLDISFIILAVMTAIYHMQAFQDLVWSRPGITTLADIIWGSILTLLILEATRRTAGLPLTILAGSFLAYAFFGNLLPASIGNRGYSFERIVNQLYLTLQGFYGLPLQIIIQYVGLFVAFGAILEASGAANFLINFAKVVAGRITGGLAQVAVFVSCLMGTISGTAVGNVATTGSVTIPTMKKGGYPPHMAGAVEATASTGGQIMPPIMGAAAFLMADFIGIPYLEVAKAALLPAILFFLGLMFSIYFFAKKNNIAKLEENEIPKLVEVMKLGVYHLIPIIVLISVLLAGRSPIMAGTLGLASALVLSFLNKSDRMTVKKLTVTFTNAGENLSTLAPLSAAAGILIGVVTLTGLGPRLSSMLIDISQGHIWLLLILTAITSIIFGMGMTTTAAYIILATLVAPALTNLGVEPILAHMFIFYFGMLSMITPPVGLASYTAAAIAGTSPNKVGFQSFKMAFPIFLVPFFFVYNPELALQGSLSDVIVPILTSVLGILLFSAALMGYFIKRINLVERGLLICSSICLLIGTLVTDLIGVLLLIIVVIVNAKKSHYPQKSSYRLDELEKKQSV